MSSPSGSVGSTESINPFPSLQVLRWDPSSCHDLDTGRVARKGDDQIEQRISDQEYDFFKCYEDKIVPFANQLRGLLTQHIVRAHQCKYEEAHGAYADKAQFLTGEMLEIELVIQKIFMQVFAKQLYEIWEVQAGKRVVVGYDCQLVQVFIDPDQLDREALLLTSSATKVLSVFHGFVNERSKIQW